MYVQEYALSAPRIPPLAYAQQGKAFGIEHENVLRKSSSLLSLLIFDLPRNCGFLMSMYVCLYKQLNAHKSKQQSNNVRTS